LETVICLIGALQYRRFSYFEDFSVERKLKKKKMAACVFSRTQCIDGVQATSISFGRATEIA